MNEQAGQNANDRNQEFLLLLGKHELQVSACVHALVPDWQDAEDVLQEARLTLWREFDSFESGTDFSAWARTIARYAVRTHFKKRQRKPFVLSEDVGDLVVAQMAQSSEPSDRRLAILAACVRKLGADAVELLRRCYVERQKIKDIAAELGRSLTGTYSAMSRIRRDLFECVRSSLQREDEP